MNRFPKTMWVEIKTVSFSLTKEKVMTRTSRFSLVVAATVVVLAISLVTLVAQAPIPVQGQRGAQGGQGQQGQRGGQGQQAQQGQGQRGGGQNQYQPPQRVVSALATASAEVTGPGKFYETLMELKPNANMAHFKYEAKEYFVSGVANGQPYKTRIVIRKPVDNTKFNGLILAESMHPSGNPWVFHFTHVYSMSTGVIGVEILTSAVQGFIDANRERYGT